MTVLRRICLALAGVFLLCAIISFVVQFDRTETTTTAFAGGATGFAMLALTIKGVRGELQ